jgi:AcrR family transcriptional regulator
LGARVRPAAEESTRARMLAAAVDCILEEGYYRASSNRIAQRAGVTWGVIQHHFGTREQLLLAVARDGVEHLLTSLQDAAITGDTVEERVASLVDTIWENYRRPAFLAHMQILLNLSKDPGTSAATKKALADTERPIGALWRQLVDQVPLRGELPPGMRTVIFSLIRGVAIGEGMLSALPHTSGHSTGAGEETRDALVRAVTLLIESAAPATVLSPSRRSPAGR